ncbi:MAG: putative Ig domain-containing protein [Nanoarchaeota archaeon]
MNTKLTFGISIIFLLALVSVHANQVNETMLDQLLNAYGSDYDDGSFNVIYTGYNYTAPSYGSIIPAIPTYANPNTGSNWVNFSISGLGTTNGQDYIVVATTEISRADYGYFGNVNQKINMLSGSTKLKVPFDGKYYGCLDYNSSIIHESQTNIKIFQQGILKYQKEFTNNIPCRTLPVILSYGTSKGIEGLNLAGDGKFEKINLTLNMLFWENGTYTIGAYLWDNKSATAYAEKTISFPAMAKYYPWDDYYYSYSDYLNKTITLEFNATQLKDFELNNTQIRLKEISIDGNTMDFYHHMPDETILWPVYDIIYEYNYWFANTFNSSSFDYGNIYINSYQFTEDVSSGKVKNLNVILNNNGYPGTYNVELSLENQYGEVVLTNKSKVSSWPATIKFNGTEIYQSKINGPYRLGFIRITNITTGNEVFYKIQKGLSKELTYMNFTTPNMPDLRINDSDLKSDGTNLNITLHNQGTGDAVGVTISIFKSDATKIKEIILSNVSAGVNYKKIITGINLTAGFVFIDFSNSIEERNESNNVAQLIPLNSPPVLNTIGNRNVAENQLLTFTITAADPDNITLKYNATGLPSGATFSSVTRTFSWTPSFTQSGTYPVTFIVSDGSSTDQELITITVNDFNRIPTITSTPSSTATNGIQYQYVMIAADADGDALFYKVNDTRFTKTPPNIFKWTPNNESGIKYVRFNVTDGKATSNISVAISVANIISIIPPTQEMTTTGGVIITPSIPTKDQDLSCEIPGANSAAYIYKWYKNNEIQNSQNSNLISKTLTETSQKWKCQMRTIPIMNKYVSVPSTNIGEAEVTIN